MEYTEGYSAQRAPKVPGRMTANPLRPVARYRPGKPVAQEDSSDEDEETEDEPQQRRPRQPQAKPARPAAQTVSQEDDEEEDDEGFVTEEEEGDAIDVQDVKQQVRSSDLASDSVRTQNVLSGQVTGGLNKPGIDDAEDEEEDEESESDEDEESSSEEEIPRPKFQRPTFIKKADRNANGDRNDTVDRVTPAQDTEVDEQARRLEQADLMIKDKLEKDALARAAGKKAWDDDEEVAPEDMVDDTDGLDPDVEHQAWKLREFKRIKRDREAIEAQEKEIEERERRKNLTTEEREREDNEFLEKQKEEHDQGRGKATFLQRYHHKGAFFQDDEAAEILKKRDLMGAKFVDDVDKSALPEYMRIRDMTKLGKKGRTRYTDLKGEDTGRFGDDVKRWRGSNSNDKYGEGNGVSGVDERFLPDRGDDRQGPTGANASALGSRRERRSRSRSPRRDGGPPRDSYRPRGRSRSRSRSPITRKRSPSPYQDRDKRRRVEAG